MHDPGWRRVAIIIIPIVGTSRLRLIQLSAIEQVRALWLSFASSAMLIVLVASVIARDLRPGDAMIAAVVVVGAVSLAIVRRAMRRALDASSVTALWGSYRTRFFIGVAYSEAPLLVGFVLTIVDRSMWITVVGAAFALAGFWLVAPTRGRVAREGLLEARPPAPDGDP